MGCFQRFFYTFITTICRKIDKRIYSLKKQDEVFGEIERAFNVSLDYRFLRLELFRNYRKDIYSTQQIKNQEL